MQKKYNDDAWTTATGNKCKKKEIDARCRGKEIARCHMDHARPSPGHLRLHVESETHIYKVRSDTR